MRTPKAIHEPGRRIPISEAIARADQRKTVLRYTGLDREDVMPWGRLEQGQLVEVWGEQAQELLRTGDFEPR